MSKNLYPRMLINLAYEIAKKEFNDRSFSFQSLWSLVWNRATDFKGEKVENWIGIFYTDLCQDRRFLVCGPTTWCLKESITVAKAEKIANTMFLYENDDIFEEGYENTSAADFDAGIKVGDIFEIDQEIKVDEQVNADEDE